MSNDLMLFDGTKGTPRAFFATSLFHVHILQAELTTVRPSAHPQKLMGLHFNKSSIMANNAKYTREIKSRIAMVKAAFNKEALFTSKLDCNLRKKPA